MNRRFSFDPIEFLPEALGRWLESDERFRPLIARLMEGPRRLPSTITAAQLCGLSPSTIERRARYLANSTWKRVCVGLRTEEECCRLEDRLVHVGAVAAVVGRSSRQVQRDVLARKHLTPKQLQIEFQRRRRATPG